MKHYCTCHTSLFVNAYLTAQAMKQLDCKSVYYEGILPKELDYLQDVVHLSQTNERTMRSVNQFFETLESQEKTAFMCKLDKEYGLVFYAMLSGMKIPKKRCILNNCIHLYVLQNMQKNDGNPYEP